MEDEALQKASTMLAFLFTEYPLLSHCFTVLKISNLNKMQFKTHFVLDMCKNLSKLVKPCYFTSTIL